MSGSPQISVDYSLCEAHGRCYQLAPAIFHSDDEGRGVVNDQVAEGAIAELERVVALCPTAAISYTQP